MAKAPSKPPGRGRENVPDPNKKEVKDAAKTLPKGHSAAGRVLQQQKQAKTPAPPPKRPTKPKK